MMGRICGRWAALSALVLAACSGDALDPDRTAVSSVELTPPTLTVAVGATVAMRAEVRDADGTLLSGRQVFWASDDESIAQVDDEGVVRGIKPGKVQIAASSEGKFAIAEVTVAPQAVASIRLTPTQRSLQVGQSVQIVAEPLDGSGNVLSGRPVSFSSGNPSVATVSQAGLVTAVGPGGATITATSESRSATAAITVSVVPVASVVVSPSSEDIVVGQTTQLAAVAKDAAGSTLSGRVFGWSTNNPSIATVSSTGLVTAVGAGTAIVSASIDGRSGASTITVRPKPVGAVILSPSQTSLTVGATVQLTTQVIDATGNVLTGRPIAFASSAPSIAMVSGGGVVTAIAPGNAVITATSEGKVGTADIVVTAVPVAAVDIAPTSVSLTIGQTAQLTATTKSATGAVLPGRLVRWTSGAPSIATVSQGGLVTAVGVGSAVIFASADGAVGTATVTTRKVPVGSVDVQPATGTVAAGSALQLTVTVRDANGTIVTDRLVGWTSSDESVALVSTGGRVTGIKAGTVTITASAEGQSGTSTITVTPVPVASVLVAPAQATLTVGQTFTFVATPVDRNGNALPGRTATWASSDNDIATVDGSGRVSALAPGSATITATIDGIAGTASVAVSAVPVASVTISPPTASLVVGGTVTLAPTTRDASGAVLTGRTVSWATSDAAVATVTQSGLVTAVAPGTATITATSEGQSATAAISVAAAPVATVSVAPSTSTIDVGQPVLLSATTRDAAGTVLTGRLVTWSSTDLNVATVDQSGLVTAVATGTVTITATSEGQIGSATVTVNPQAPPSVASVVVSPNSTTIKEGRTMQLRARTYDALGNELLGRLVTWTTSDSSIATVDTNGVVTALKKGNVTITATSEGQSGTSVVKVN